jgi:hypothetical protein
MRQPVINPNGFTFEKDTILEWLKTKQECPMTKNKLTKKDLRLNKNALNYIQYLVYKERYNSKCKSESDKINESDFLKI